MSEARPVSDTRDATDIKSIGEQRPEIPTAANIVGVDGEGCVHFHSPREDRVWVVDPDPDAPLASVCTHEQRVERIHDWIDHTEACRGAWRDLRYHEGSLGAALAETIGEAIDESQ